MASKVIGEMSARLGLDPKDFLEKMKGIQGVSAFTSAAMARQWKDTAREGNESFRLIDESLGIHISRPLTKLITREFPAFAGVLQSVLGGAAVGALATIGFEAFEKMSRKMDDAKKALEAYDQAVRHTSDVIGELGASHAKAMKEIELQLNALQGKPGAKMAESLFKIDSASAAEAKKSIGEIAEAMEKEAKAAQTAGKWTTTFWATAGYVMENFFSSSGAQAESVNAKFQNFKHTLDGILQANAADPMKGVRDSLAALDRELSTTGADIARKMTAIQVAAATTVMLPGSHGSQIATHPNAGVDPVALAAQQKYFEMLKAQGKALEDILTEDQGHRAAATAVGDQYERWLRATQALAKLHSDIAGGLGKLAPEADPIARMRTEIVGFKQAADNAFRDLKDSKGATPLSLKTALAELDEYKQKLDALFVKFRQDTEITQAMAKLPASVGKMAPMNLPAAAPVLPTLGAGGTLAAQFATFQGDQNAQMAAAKKAYEDIITPQQKYDLGVQELSLLLKKGLIDGQAYTAGVAQLEAAFVKAADAAHKLQEEMLRLLERSSDPGAGFQAFLKQLQIQGTGDAKMVFDDLNAAWQGAEQNAAKSLIAIIENNRRGNQSLINELKAMWKSYFESLAEMAIKQAMTKAMAGLIDKIMPKKPTTAGIPGLGGGPPLVGGKIPDSTSLAAAGTSLQDAAAQLIAAAEALKAAGGAGGGAGGGLSGLLGLGGLALNESPSSAAAAPDWASVGETTPLMAEGGNVAPGGSFISGEAGAERVDMSSRGGAHITPLGFSTKSGDTHIHYDMRGAVVTDDLVRKADAARAMSDSETRAVARSVSMTQDIARRGGTPARG